MRYEFEFVIGQIIDVALKLSGPMSAEDTDECLAALLRDPHWRPEMKVLVDGIGLTAEDLGASDVRALAKTVVSNDNEWGAGFTAVAVEDPAVYGLMRMWSVATDAAQRTTEVFYNLDDALVWLAAV